MPSVFNLDTVTCCLKFVISLSLQRLGWSVILDISKRIAEPACTVILDISKCIAEPVCTVILDISKHIAEPVCTVTFVHASPAL